MSECAFGPCHCKAKANEKYCSEFCEAFAAGWIAGTTAKGGVPQLKAAGPFNCGCGHAFCLERSHAVVVGPGGAA